MSEGRGARGEWRGEVAGHDGAWMEPWVAMVEPEGENVAWWRGVLAALLLTLAEWLVNWSARLLGEEGVSRETGGDDAG